MNSRELIACANRYVWLRDNKHLDTWWSVQGPEDRKKNIDADIDAAMKAQRCSFGGGGWGE